MLRSFFICCFACCSVMFSLAQSNAYEYVDTTVLEHPKEEQASASGNDMADTTLYTHDISIAADSINSWKSNKRFAYAKNLDSLLKLKEQEMTGEYTSRGRSSSASFLQRLLSSDLLRLCAWMAAIGIVLFILYKLFLNKGIFKKNISSLRVTELPDEHIASEPSDYDALIQQSFKLADYRMAVRYLFLKTLRQLTDKGLLQYAADKTNSRYVQEIAANRKNEFASLVLTYERVWYGRLTVNREQFEQIEKGYISFYNKI